MNRRRVVVTGIGALTPIGVGKDALWQGLRAQRSAVGPLTRFDPSIFRSHNAAEIPDFVPSDFVDAKRVRRLDRFGQFSVAASRLAIQDAELLSEWRVVVAVHYAAVLLGDHSSRAQVVVG